MSEKNETRDLCHEDLEVETISLENECLEVHDSIEGVVEQESFELDVVSGDGSVLLATVYSIEELDFLLKARNSEYWNKEFILSDYGGYTVGELILNLMDHEPLSELDPEDLYKSSELEFLNFIDENEDYFRGFFDKDGLDWFKKHVVFADMLPEEGYHGEQSVGIAYLKVQMDNPEKALDSFLPEPSYFCGFDREDDEEILNEFNEAFEKLDGAKVAEMFAGFAYNPNSYVNASVVWDEDTKILTYTTASGGVEIGVDLKESMVWFKKRDSEQGLGRYSHMRAGGFLRGLYPRKSRW